MNCTFCLLSCGEDTEIECLASIENFKDKIIFQEVRNISPQSKALNTMIMQCRTDYLVPLDSDFILNKNALDRITEAINSTKLDNWHSILFPMWDILTQEKIRSLKVFNTKIVKNFLYKNVRNPDAQHFSDLQAAGYKCIEYMSEDPIGNHVCRGKIRCYSRYKDVVFSKIKTKGRIFAIRYALNHHFLFERFLKETKNDDYLYCILGLYDGLSCYDYSDISKSNLEEINIESEISHVRERIKKFISMV